MRLRWDIYGAQTTGRQTRKRFGILFGLPVCCAVLGACFMVWSSVVSALPHDVIGILPYALAFTLAAGALSLLAAEVTTVSAWRAWSVIALVEKPKSYQAPDGANRIQHRLVQWDNVSRIFDTGDGDGAEKKRQTGNAVHDLHASAGDTRGQA